ncbi:MAG: HoxN/HupN/NixA family nickel/cobalt transporter, partial [Acidimicrobiales bacterium]
MPTATGTRWAPPEVGAGAGAPARKRRLAGVRAALTPSEWRRVGGMAGFIGLLHVVGWGLLVGFIMPAHFHLGTKVYGLGVGVLAFNLVMRHAFDADHISAIDNTTRKLMADGQRPLGVGLFFSLGHSSVVFLAALLLSFGVRAIEGQVVHGGSALHNLTSLFGTLVSGGFLYLIAALNLIILVSVVKIFWAMRRGRFDQDELEAQLEARGFMYRFFGGLARRIDSPWKMYPVGFLFGLGFDTATEIALLFLAASGASGHLPIWAVLDLPVLFAAGMSLLDTADGSFMNFAYEWAFSQPVRKVYYNITITGLSVAVAFIIGTIEVLQVVQGQLGLRGGIWDYAAKFNINSAGFFIVGLFVVTWVAALLIWRFGRVEARWEASAARSRAERSRAERAERA